MKIIALCKTFRGDEVCEASLESVYNHVDNIVYLHSGVAWTGEKGNTVEAVIRLWKKRYDYKNKIVNIHYDCAVQEQQYKYLFEFVNKNFEHDFKMMLDTDEVWDDEAWALAMRHLNAPERRANVFTCRMKTYIKSPFFQILPLDACCPVAFVRNGSEYTGVRCSGVQPQFLMHDVIFHHFSAVRKNLGLVLDKHRMSSAIENEPIADFKQWIRLKWNMLPAAKNFHINPRYSTTWASIKIVGLADLPQAMRNKVFTQSFLNYKFYPRVTTMNKGDMLGLPENFGPGHLEWNVPSKRNKYLQLMAGKERKEAAKKELLPEPVPSTVEVQSLSPSQRNRMYKPMVNSGKLCVVTMVSGVYQWYIPLFVDRMCKEYPDYDVKVFLRGKCELPDKYLKCVTLIDTPDFKEDGYTTAAMRFVYDYPGVESYDYVLISDIDILHRSERPSLLDQRMMYLRIFRLGCYENYVSSMVEGKPRMPGVHFVTRDWWEKTAKARKRYEEYLKKNGSPAWYFDEIMIAMIVKESGLPVQDKEQHLWGIHGIHLGDYRRQIETKQPIKALDGNNAAYAKKLLEDGDFMRMVSDSSKHIPTLERTFIVFKEMVSR